MNGHAISSALGTGVVILCSIYGIAWLLRTAPSRWTPIIATGYGLHLTSNMALSTQGPRANDSIWYDQHAMQVLESWQGASQSPSDVFDDRLLFIHLLVAAYWAFGHSIMPLMALNAFAVVALAITSAHIAREFGAPERAQRLALYLALLMPVQLVWSKDLLREPYMLLLTSIVGYGALRAANGKSWFFWTLTPLALLFGFRAESAVILFISLLPGLTKSRLRVPRSIVASLCAVGLVYLLALGGIERFVPSAKERSIARAELASGSTGVPSESPSLIEPQILLRVLAGPFPWEWHGPIVMLAVDALFVWFLLFYGLRGVRGFPGLGFWALVVPAAAILLATAFTAYNYGLLVRLRAQGFVLLIPLAAAGWTYVRMEGRVALEYAASRRHGRSRVDSHVPPSTSRGE